MNDTPLSSSGDDSDNWFPEVKDILSRRDRLSTARPKPTVIPEAGMGMGRSDARRGTLVHYDANDDRSESQHDLNWGQAKDQPSRGPGIDCPTNKLAEPREPRRQSRHQQRPSPRQTTTTPRIGVATAEPRRSLPYKVRVIDLTQDVEQCAQCRRTLCATGLTESVRCFVTHGCNCVYCERCFKRQIKGSDSPSLVRLNGHHQSGKDGYFKCKMKGHKDLGGQYVTLAFAARNGECPICLTEKLCEPRVVFNCGHIICTDCHALARDHARRNIDTIEHNERCPTCRSESHGRLLPFKPLSLGCCEDDVAQ